MLYNIQGVIVLTISNRLRARPILKLLVQLLPELYSTQSNYYFIIIIVFIIIMMMIHDNDYYYY